VEELVKEGFTIKDACFGSGISQSRYCELSSKKPGGNREVKQISKKQKFYQNYYQEAA